MRQIFFKTFLEFSKAFQSRVSKHCIQLSLPVKNLVCFIYFKELLKISARLIQIEQVLQIGAKLLQIGAVPVVTNRDSSSYYKLGKIITNWNSYYKLGQNYYKSGQVLRIGAEHQLQLIRIIFQVFEQ